MPQRIRRLRPQRREQGDGSFATALRHRRKVRAAGEVVGPGGRGPRVPQRGPASSARNSRSRVEPIPALRHEAVRIRASAQPRRYRYARRSTAAVGRTSTRPCCVSSPARGHRGHRLPSACPERGRVPGGRVGAAGEDEPLYGAAAVVLWQRAGLACSSGPLRSTAGGRLENGAPHGRDPGDASASPAQVPERLHEAVRPEGRVADCARRRIWRGSVLRRRGTGRGATRAGRRPLTLHRTGRLHPAAQQIQRIQYLALQGAREDLLVQLKCRGGENDRRVEKSLRCHAGARMRSGTNQYENEPQVVSAANGWQPGRLRQDLQVARQQERALSPCGGRRPGVEGVRGPEAALWRPVPARPLCVHDGRHTVVRNVELVAKI